MRTVHTIAELRQTLAQWRARGQRIGFVPTMGNLHAGHTSLIDSARERCDRVVVSIFVNPLQFGLNEDYEQYPRTLAADQEVLRARGADLLFAPSDAEMYPRGMPETVVRVGGITEDLCGRFRPGHFEGVATVVSILFHLVGPDVAVFGIKDYQQFEVIRRMVDDLRFPVALVAAPVVRDADGLAMSSRNQYLSAEERAVAPLLYRTLCEVARRVMDDFDRHREAIDEGLQALQAAGFAPQYLELRSRDLSAPDASGPWVLLAAARLGATRLIDNLRFSRDGFEQDVFVPSPDLPAAGPGR